MAARRRALRPTIAPASLRWERLAFLAPARPLLADPITQPCSRRLTTERIRLRDLFESASTADFV
jgi:hypothetical protein